MPTDSARACDSLLACCPGSCEAKSERAACGGRRLKASRTAQSESSPAESVVQLLAGGREGSSGSEPASDAQLSVDSLCGSPLSVLQLLLSSPGRGDAARGLCPASLTFASMLRWPCRISTERRRSPTEAASSLRKSSGSQLAGACAPAAEPEACAAEGASAHAVQAQRPTASRKPAVLHACSGVRPPSGAAAWCSDASSRLLRSACSNGPQTAHCTRAMRLLETLTITPIRTA
mmetsp:Transcript_105653/g.340737  ORF Transcript_105653/g.340737 Transcript_105653/m.340737 type:complete len:234 (+) Transcript_105653:1208-1909(+)